MCVLDYGREAGISRIMNLIDSHQSLLNARVCLVLFIHQHHSLLACFLSILTLTELVPDREKLMEKEGEEKKEKKRQEKKKKCFY